MSWPKIFQCYVETISSRKTLYERNITLKAALGIEGIDCAQLERADAN